MVKLDLAPPRRTLRSFGLVALAGFGALAALVWWRGGLFGASFGDAARPVAVALASVGAASALAGLVYPPANRPLWVLLSVVTFPIGVVVSYALLMVVFYGLVTPVGLALRLFGRDPLALRRRPSATTYWHTREPARDKGRYLRQS